MFKKMLKKQNKKKSCYWGLLNTIRQELKKKKLWEDCLLMNLERWNFDLIQEKLK